MSKLDLFTASNQLDAGSASLLAVRKSMECNPAMMYSCTGIDGDLHPITVDESTVLGVQSQAGLDDSGKMKKKNPTPEEVAAFEAERMVRVTRGNPQRIETAFLPPDHDTLVIQFTARANGKKGLPLELCSSPALASHLGSLYDHYCEIGGADYLGSLFAANLADASFAFRNRPSEEIVTQVTVRSTQTLPEGKKLTFTINKDNDSFLNYRDSKKPVADAEVLELGNIIGRGLAGEELVMLEVTSWLKIGKGQEVYPSQEMTDDNSKTALGRVYYKDPNTRQAKMHAQKIGNAVRRIDIWHPSIDLFGPLPAEPYGNYARRAVAVRLSENFYKRFLRPEYASLKSSKGEPTRFCEQMLSAQNIQDIHEIENAHFFMAILMRGGVLGLESEKDAA